MRRKDIRLKNYDYSSPGAYFAEKVDEKLKEIMKNIHASCVKYGTREDGYVDYVKGANVAGFLKVARAMMAQGLC